MWICTTCNEKIEDSFDTCWKCYKGSEREKEDNEIYNQERELLKKLEKQKTTREVLLVKKWKRTFFVLVIFSIPISMLVEFLLKLLTLFLGFGFINNNWKFSGFNILLILLITSVFIRYTLLHTDKKINNLTLYSFKIFITLCFGLFIFSLFLNILFR